MTKDLNKSISLITYNHLNQPVEVSMSNNRKTVYTYTATGLKLKTEVYGENGSYNITEYSGAFVYENAQLSYINIPDGRYVVSTGKYEYNLSDHLGNVRATFTKSATGSALLIQEDHYYPFGLQMSGQHFENTTILNKYLYNGKEKQTQTGYFDYGFRQLDPQLCRWHVVDAMAEMYLSTSPYAYVRNNPINHSDFMGLFENWEEVNDIIDDLFSSPWGGTASSGGGGPSYFINGDAAKSWAVENRYYDPSIYKGNGVGGHINYYTKITWRNGLASPKNHNLTIRQFFKWLFNWRFESKQYGEMVWDDEISQNKDLYPIYFIFEDVTPHIYENAEAALASNPEWHLLEYNGGGLAAELKRRQSAQVWTQGPCGSGYSREEFPPACSNEGGYPAFQTCVPKRENWVQGGQLRWVTNGMNKGDIFEVVLVPSNDRITQPIYKPDYVWEPDLPWWLVLIRVLERVPTIVVP